MKDEKKTTKSAKSTKSRAKKRAPTEEEILEKQAQEILDLAKEYGVEQNYFFTTTFARYQEQLKLLKGLKAAMDEDGLLITKEYVKGRGNLCANPAISEYNKTSTAANQTVATLMKIISAARKESGKSSDTKDDEEDAFTAFLKSHKKV